MISSVSGGVVSEATESSDVDDLGDTEDTRDTLAGPFTG